MEKYFLSSGENKQLEYVRECEYIRHEGYDIKNITYFPTFVYVTVLKNKDYDLIEEIVADDLITIGRGELYKTYDRAKNHIFD